jgi:DNA-binding LacI/PurR family transcriptional regulator
MSDGGKRVQMADIARLAGVSVATVSRALNGSPLINAETRERIASIARSHNYSINTGAQNLRLRKNQTVAVVVPFDAQSRQHISDPFFLAIVGSIADALTDRGYDMLLSRVDAERLDTAAALYDSGRAIGVVIIGQWRHHDQLNELAVRKVPVVVWGAQMPQQAYCSVGGDNVGGGAQATRHLLQQGRKRIVFVGDAQLPEVGLRRQGYQQALREAGVSVDAKLEVKVPFEIMAAREALDRLCAGRVKFDGVVACSDLLALQAVQAVRAVGRRVPEDVAVIGYDDMPLATWSDPPLTTVHQPVNLAGGEIVDALLALLRGERAAARVLPVHLVVRESAPTVRS